MIPYQDLNVLLTLTLTPCPFYGDMMYSSNTSMTMMTHLTMTICQMLIRFRYLLKMSLCT